MQETIEQKPVKIFVEGDADIKFLSDYINSIIPEFKIEKEVIIKTDGWCGIYKEDNKEELSRNTNNAGINLVIFDADDDFEQRKKELENWGESKNLSFEIFLFPNNKDKGTLEDLLENIIVDKNQPIFDCWNDYENCLRNKKIEGRKKPLTVPAKKTKIYGYLEALLEKTDAEKKKIKESNRDYKNKEHWNLDADYLNPLKDFLLKHIKT